MAIAIDATAGNGSTNAAVSSFIRPITVGAGLSNGILCAMSACRGAALAGDLVVSSISFAGTNLTKALAQPGTDLVATRLNCEIWYLLNPPAGLGTLTFNTTGVVTFATGFGASFSGVDPTVPIAATNGSSRDAATDPSPVLVPFSGLPANVFLVNSIYHKTGGAITPGNSATAIGTAGPNSDGDRSGAAYQGPLTTNGTTSWTYVTDDAWLEAAVALNPFVAASGAIPVSWRGLRGVGY